MSRPTVAEIAPNLFMGSRPPHDARMGKRFDVILLCAKELHARSHHWPGYQPTDFGGAQAVYVPLDDHRPTAQERELALAAARLATRALASGKRVLSTCNEGRNRSGWVAGLAWMMRSGDSAAQTVRRIKARRGAMALTNEHFVRELHEFERSMRPRK